MASTFDVCVRGAGIVGKALALLLARSRLRVALVTNRRAPEDVADVRAYALNDSSKKLLESLRCWPESPHVTAVMDMQVCGDKHGKLAFHPPQKDSNHPLAWVTDVAQLSSLLSDAIQYQTTIEWVDEPLAAPLTVVCEGRDSISRQSWGVLYEARPYPDIAIATRVNCELMHQHTACQWFGNNDVLAFLPLDGVSGKKVAVIWSSEQEKAQERKDMSAADFVSALEQASAGTFGSLELCADRHAWPLQIAHAVKWCGSIPSKNPSQNPTSWVLAGDAAHTVHPLAGQGLNLGLADAQTLARHLQNRAYWRSLGDLTVLRAYERERKSHLWPMAFVTDGLRHLFTRTEPPVQFVRNWGMSGLNQITPMKDWLIRQAAGSPL